MPLLLPLAAQVPKGTDRNVEWKLLLQLWKGDDISEIIGRALGQQHSGPLRRRRWIMQPQTDEQRGKRACALTAKGSITSAKPREISWVELRKALQTTAKTILQP